MEFSGVLEVDCTFFSDRLKTCNLLVKIVLMKHLGPASKKLLLLLAGGLTLGLTRRPDAYFRIVKGIAREWKKIDERNLRITIKKLYQSKLVDYKENKDGNVNLVLTDNGRNRILKYDIDKIVIKRPAKWDGLWR